jgi:hypothetical protein
MSTYRYTRIQKGIASSLAEVPSGVVYPAAAAASAMAGVEGFHSIAFEELPAEVIQQLRTDGTHGIPRSIEEARAVYEHNVPAEAKGSIEGVESITSDPHTHWMHKEPFAHGGSSDASNGVYGPGELNHAIGDRPMTAAEIHQAHASTDTIAHNATPSVTGDLGHVAGHTVEAAAMGGVFAAGVAAAHRYAQAQGFRDAGRHDLAAMAEQQLVEDATKGAISGMVRGTSVAVTQAVLGANPVTAAIGIVAPDVVRLMMKRDELSADEFQQRGLALAGKGALATALVCAGPVGWLGLAGLSIAAAYSKANPAASSNARLWQT